MIMMMTFDSKEHLHFYKYYVKHLIAKTATKSSLEAGGDLHQGKQGCYILNVL